MYCECCGSPTDSIYHAFCDHCESLFRENGMV